MRNLFVLLAGVLLLGSAFALFSRATWGEPIGVGSLRSPPVQDKATVQDVVRAKKFILVNEKGTPVGTFGVSSGQTRLMLRDENGRPRAMVAVAKGGQPGFVLFDENAKVRAHFHIEASEPRLMLRDENGRPRATVFADKAGQPGIMLYDENGRVRAQFDIEKSEPRLMLLDKNGETTFQALP